MLRAVVLVLVLANLGFFVWSQGWLDSIVGVRSIGDREPERMARQVRPEQVRILTPGERSSVPASAPAFAATSAPTAAASAPAPLSAASAAAPVACLEAGPYTDLELNRVRSAAQAMVPGTVLSTAGAPSPVSWLVYMGPFPSREAVDRKIDEIRRRDLPYEEIRDTATSDTGISLGRFETRAAAADALQTFALRGVQTARIVERAAAAPSLWLRVASADADVAARLAGLKGALLGKDFVACGDAPAR